MKIEFEFCINNPQSKRESKKNLIAISFFLIFSLVVFQAKSSAIKCLFFYGQPAKTYVLSLGKVRSIALQPPNRSTIKIFAQKLSVLTRIAKNVASHVKTIRAGRSIRTVIYPASGFDAATGFTVFSNASTVIGIDRHRFLPFDAISVAPSFSLSDPSYQNGWAKFSEVDRAKTVAGDLIGRLFTLEIHVRILSVTHIESEKNASHGIVEFDFGPNTQIRRYIHIQSTDISKAVLPLFDSTVDALLLKASQDFFNPESNPLVSKIIDTAVENHAIIVDGDGGFSPYIKDIGNENAGKFKKPAFNENTRIKRFGYGETIIVHY